MESEQIIASFLKPPGEGGIYSDAALVAVLRHAESGRLSFFSCCCFAGIPSAKHELRGEVRLGPNSISEHYREGHDVPMIPDHKWLAASMAYVRLGETDEERRTKLIPLIKTETMRRESLRAQSEMDALCFRCKKQLATVPSFSPSACLDCFEGDSVSTEMVMV